MNAIFQAGNGAWDVTNYPYGGKFVRPAVDTPCEVIATGHVKYPALEKRVKLADGRIWIVREAALVAG